MDHKLSFRAFEVNGGVSIVAEFANPFLACEECGRQVVSRPEDNNLPCGHRADFASVCPSWGPVDGCQCVQQLGSRDHGDPE